MKYREILFEVWSDLGKFRIYANGQVEGFGKTKLTINQFPLLKEQFLRDYLSAKGIAFQSATEIDSTSSSVGAAHSTNGSSGSDGEHISAALGEK